MRAESFLSLRSVKSDETTPSTILGGSSRLKKVVRFTAIWKTGRTNPILRGRILVPWLWKPQRLGWSSKPADWTCGKVMINFCLISRLLGCPRKFSKWLGSMGYNLLINGIYWGYNPLTNLLLISWDIQVGISHGRLYLNDGCFHEIYSGIPCYKVGNDDWWPSQQQTSQQSLKPNSWDLKTQKTLANGKILLEHDKRAPWKSKIPSSKPIIFR